MESGVARWDSTSEIERKIYLNFPVYSAIAGLLAQKGTSTLKKYFGYLTILNAMEHAFNSALITIHLGYNIAKVITGVHEIDNIEKRKSIYDSYMDLHNNLFGINLGIKLRNNYWYLPVNILEDMALVNVLEAAKVAKFIDYNLYADNFDTYFNLINQDFDKLVYIRKL